MKDTSQPTETAESIALAKWLASVGLTFTHIANGKGRSKIEGRHLKLMGVQKGFPDYLIFDAPRVVCTHAKGLALELKKREGGETRGNQTKWLEKMRDLGWLGTVAEGAQQAVSFVAYVYQITLPVALELPQLELFIPDRGIR